MAGQIGYRARQFFWALRKSPGPGDVADAQAVLTAGQMKLFRQMQPGEQAHALQVFRALRAEDEVHPDLAVAALLHDVGKGRCPLKLWERIWIVLGRAVIPGMVQRWGHEQLKPGQNPAWWKRAWMVGEQHPAWGAEMALEAGVSPLAANLIHRHQDHISTVDNLEDELLLRLQRVDGEN